MVSTGYVVLHESRASLHSNVAQYIAHTYVHHDACEGFRACETLPCAANRTVNPADSKRSR